DQRPARLGVARAVPRHPSRPCLGHAHLQHRGSDARARDRLRVQPAAGGARSRPQAAFRPPGRRQSAHLRRPRQPPADLAGQLHALPGELLPQALQAGRHPGAVRVQGGREPLPRPQERAHRAPAGPAQAPDPARQARPLRRGGMADAIARGGLVLGLLAGGRARRLGGLDKAWLQREGQPQVLRLARALAGDVDHVLVSANRDLARYAAHGLAAVPDRVADAGPIGALDALAAACRAPWLLTLPVDVVEVPGGLLQALASGRAANGARLPAGHGPQPLVALWRPGALRDAVATALAAREHAVHALQARLGMAEVRLDGVRLGNLNTPGDLRAAGVQVEEP